MKKIKKKKLRLILKWVLWVLVVQAILANISAATYAFKFTHFYDGPPPAKTSANALAKTWKLFVGPSFYKDSTETDPSFPFESVKLHTSQGFDIDAWYSHTGSSQKCMILLHGWSGNKSFLNHEAAMFRSMGFNVLMIDLRAHGRSEGNNITFGFDETDEVESAYAYATKRGNDKIILYGVSLGAAIGIKAASEEIVDLAAVIAEMPLGSMHRHFKTRAEHLGFPPEPFASLVTFWIGVQNGYNGFRHDVSSYAKDVACPVLLQWGDKDRIVVRSEVEKVFNNFPSKKKKMVVYEGTGHDLLLKNDPLKWEREVRAFISSLEL